MEIVNKYESICICLGLGTYESSLPLFRVSVFNLKCLFPCRSSVSCSEPTAVFSFIFTAHTQTGGVSICKCHTNTVSCSVMWKKKDDRMFWGGVTKLQMLLLEPRLGADGRTGSVTGRRFQRKGKRNDSGACWRKTRGWASWQFSWKRFSSSHKHLLWWKTLWMIKNK